MTDQPSDTTNGDTYSLSELESVIKWAVSNSVSPTTISQLLLCQSLLKTPDYAQSLLFKQMRVRHDDFRITNTPECDSVQKQPLSSPLLLFTSVEDDTDIFSVWYDDPKKNKDYHENNGKLVSTIGCLRNRELYMCFHFWLAASLVERYHYFSEPAPFSFTASRFQVDNAKLFAIIVKQEGGNGQAIVDLLNNALGSETRPPCFTTQSPKKSAIEHYKNTLIDASDLDVFGSLSPALFPNEFGEYHFDYYTKKIPVNFIACLGGGYISETDHCLTYSINRGLVSPNSKVKSHIFPFINDILNDPFNYPRGIGANSPFDLSSNMRSDGHHLFKDREESNQKTYDNNTKELCYQLALCLDYLRGILIEDYKFFEEWLEKSKIDPNNVNLTKLYVWQTQEYKEFRKEQDEFYANYFVEVEKEKELAKQYAEKLKHEKELKEAELAKKAKQKEEAEKAQKLKQLELARQARHRPKQNGNSKFKDYEDNLSPIALDSDEDITSNEPISTRRRPAARKSQSTIASESSDSSTFSHVPKKQKTNKEKEIDSLKATVMLLMNSIEDKLSLILKNVEELTKRVEALESHKESQQKIKKSESKNQLDSGKNKIAVVKKTADKPSPVYIEID